MRIVCVLFCYYCIELCSATMWQVFIVSIGLLNRYAHGIQLEISVPLKTAAELFTLYKTVDLPSRLSNDTFITYQLDYYYFGLAVDQRDYTLLAKAHLQRCTTGSVTICPAKVPSYHSQVLTCEASLFFQNSNSFKLCRKNLLLHYQTPTLLHHGSKWAYHFPEPRQVTIRCPRKMAGPHILWRSVEAVLYTARPPTTSHPRR
jgi:hypothetical protein